MKQKGRIEVLSSLKRYYMEICTYAPSWHRSTMRWACDEIARYIVENPCKNPYELILEFSDKMDRYSLKNKKFSGYFSEARALALDFYDEIGGV